MYVSAFAPSPRSVGNDQWFEAYQAVEYRNPDTYSVNGYVGMQALLAGATKADSFERNAVADALRNDTVPTLLNDLRFEPDGDLVEPRIWIYQVVDGEFQQVQ
jgi:branched-chain amino acid transport system substrate-binding protein